MADSPGNGGGPPSSDAEGSSLRKCRVCEKWLLNTNFGQRKAGSSRGLKSECRQCAAALQRRYRLEHLERCRAYNKEWAKKNPDKKRKSTRASALKHRLKINARTKTYKRQLRRNHPEEYRAKAKAYKTANRDRILERQRQYANSEVRRHATREWKAAHPEFARAYASRRRATILDRLVSDNVTPVNIAARWGMFGDRCYICGAPAAASDHVVSLNRGGPHCLSNLRPACSPCNFSKNKTSLFDYLTRKGISLWKQPIPRLP